MGSPLCSYTTTGRLLLHTSGGNDGRITKLARCASVVVSFTFGFFLRLSWCSHCDGNLSARHVPVHVCWLASLLCANASALLELARCIFFFKESSFIRTDDCVLQSVDSQTRRGKHAVTLGKTCYFYWKVVSRSTIWPFFHVVLLFRGDPMEHAGSKDQKIPELEMPCVCV